jgi:hypothetical protein
MSRSNSTGADFNALSKYIQLTVDRYGSLPLLKAGPNVGSMQSQKKLVKL